MSRDRFTIFNNTPTAVEACLFAGGTTLAYVIIEHHANFILSQPDLFYDGIPIFHKMKQPLCKIYQEFRNLFYFFTIIYKLAQQPMCIDTKRLSPYESILTILTQRLIQHGFYRHFDLVARRELKIHQTPTLRQSHKKQDTFKPLALKDVHYGLALYALGISLAVVTWIVEKFRKNCFKAGISVKFE